MLEEVWIWSCDHFYFWIHQRKHRLLWRSGYTKCIALVWQNSTSNSWYKHMAHETRTLALLPTSQFRLLLQISSQLCQGQLVPWKAAVVSERVNFGKMFCRSISKIFSDLRWFFFMDSIPWDSFAPFSPPPFRELFLELFPSTEQSQILGCYCKWM